MGGHKTSQVPSSYTPRTSLVISHSYALLHDYGYTEQDVADVVARCNHCEADINETITRMVVEGSEGRAWKTVQHPPRSVAAKKPQQRPVRDERNKFTGHRNGPTGRPRDRQLRSGVSPDDVARREAGNSKGFARKRVDQDQSEQEQFDANKTILLSSQETETASHVTPQANDKSVARAGSPQGSTQSERTTWAKKIAGGSAKPSATALAAPTPALSKQSDSSAPISAPRAYGKSSWASRARGEKKNDSSPHGPPVEPAADVTAEAPVLKVEKAVLIEAAILPSSPTTSAPTLESSVLPPSIEAPPPPVEVVIAKPVVYKTVIARPVASSPVDAGGIEHLSSTKPMVRTKILTRRDDVSNVTIPSYVPDRASLEMASVGELPGRGSTLHQEPITRHQMPLQRPMEQCVPQQPTQMPYYHGYDRMRYAPPTQPEYYPQPPTQSLYNRMPQMMGSRLEEDVPPPHMDQTRYYQPAYHHYANNCPPYDHGGARQSAEYEQAYTLSPQSYRPAEAPYAQYGGPGQYTREEPMATNRHEQHYAAQYGMPPIFMAAAPQVDERSVGRYANYNMSAGYQAPPQYSPGNLFKY